MNINLKELLENMAQKSKTTESKDIQEKLDKLSEDYDICVFIGVNDSGTRLFSSGGALKSLGLLEVAKRQIIKKCEENEEE